MQISSLSLEANQVTSHMHKLCSILILGDGLSNLCKKGPFVRANAFLPEFLSNWGGRARHTFQTLRVNRDSVNMEMARAATIPSAMRVKVS